MAPRLRDTAVRLRAPLVGGGYGGQKVRNWAAAEPGTTIPVSVQPDRSVEYTDQQQTTETRWKLFAGPAEDILATDRFRWAGADGDLEVDGDVEEWRRGTESQYQLARLKLVTSTDA